MDSMPAYGRPVPFTKMHGLGNDFVIIDARGVEISLSDEVVRALADRRRGVGCDQLIVLRDGGDADGLMEIRNADGSEVAACGNATRCIGRMLMAESGRDSASIRTRAGLLTARAGGDDTVCVNMGPARTDWQAVPLVRAMDTVTLNYARGPLSAPGAVNMGNPHAVFFVDDADAVNLATLGPEIETDPLFPEKVNVSVATVNGQDIRLRVWERGVGLTQACGTASCAALVAAHRKGLTGRRGGVRLDGGRLEIDWLADGTVEMTGPATYAFTGEVRL